MRAVRELNAAGKSATIDVLGEEVHNPEEVRAFTAAYRDVLAEIEREGLDSTTTDATLDVYRELRAEGLEQVGIVLQASLRRTVADVDALAELRPHTRICKGIYIEPEEIQFRNYEAVRASFVRALGGLLDAGCYVGIATHDEWLVDEGRRLVRERGLGPLEYEFQMLLGVRPELGRA